MYLSKEKHTLPLINKKMLKNHVEKKSLCYCQSCKYKKISNHNEAEEWICLNYEGLATIIFKVHTREKTTTLNSLKTQDFVCMSYFHV